MDSSSTNTRSELFICFTSRLSMKIPSKSIHSPGRTRDLPTSLSTSLSRRLKTNGSIKSGQGQASPMFPTKKRGCGFDNPEPSSPKVTCIGQVRVKTKKKGKKMRTLSRRQTGEVSFRKLDHSHSLSQQQESVSSRNQRWVHLPLTICEALRAFGSEFSCLFPCFTSNDKEGKTVVGSNNNSNDNSSCCGAVFARWLVALQEGEGVKERSIEMVVDRDEEKIDLGEMVVRNSRRHVFDEIDIEQVKNEDVEDDGEEERRASICVPPKNALLLMRCRSDPMKMAALTNRFWESPVPDKDDEEEEEPDGLVECEAKDDEVTQKRDSVCENEEQKLYVEMEVQSDNEKEEGEGEKQAEEDLQIIDEIPQEIESNEFVLEEDDLLRHFLFEEIEEYEDSQSDCSEKGDNSEEKEEEEEDALEVELDESTKDLEVEEKQIVTHETHEKEKEDNTKSEEREEAEKEKSVLPDCLLLMMCEPKLSMEVSKETWVCNADFIRWQPHVKPVKPTQNVDELTKKLNTEPDPNHVPIPDVVLPKENQVEDKPVQQPGRSSISLPVPNMTKIIEQKLVNTGGYLTRCKSAPLRTAPDSCFWKNRKLEPHRRSNYGIGAAGVGC